jgi:VWFA-related protein
MPSILRAAPILAAVLVAWRIGAQSPPDEPVPSELKEQIEVRLVTVDVVALDADDTTVPDMTKGEFELFVDGKPTTIDTLDTYCESGAEADPKSRRSGGWPMPRDLEDGTRRVVLAFDYLHLTTAPCPDAAAGACIFHTKALEEFQHALGAKTGTADEEMMVVALTGGLRVEQPFTRDRRAVIDTLFRMEHDISLWNGNFKHLTEESFFTALRALVTVLRTSPGAKAVVFVSAGPGPGNSYDLDYERLAAAARDARVSFYTVDTLGVFVDTHERFPHRGPVVGAPGGPPGLIRLASMTGGRPTSNTNDYSIGYARARRDLGCRYTLGFYDHHPEADKRHQVAVESRRTGVHLNYAARYTFPSEKERRTQAVEAAFLVPKQFEGGGLRAHVFSLQPQDAKRWNAVLVVDFPAVLPRSASDSTWEFGVVLRRGPDVAHSFNRSISVKRHAGDSGNDAPRVTFVEPVTLPPGNYVLTAVLVTAEGATPFGRVSDLTVPPLPKREAILTGPILGRRRGDDVVVYGGGEAKGAAGDRLGARDAFRPLLIAEVDRNEPLAALTHVCILSPKAKDGPWSIARRLETAAGEPAGSLAGVDFKSSARTRVQCERLLDELPVQQLKPGRYTFRAVLATAGDTGDQKTEGEAPFAVEDLKPEASGGNDAP